MSAGLLIDVLVVVVAAAAVVWGAARGILRTLGAIAGLLAGGAAALVVMPIVSTRVVAPGWNVAAAAAAGIALVALGTALGEAIARAVRRPVHRAGLGAVDRLLGGAAGLVVSAATVLLLAMSVGSFGVPGASQAVASSATLRFLSGVVPAPAEAALARLRSLAIEDGIPTLLDAAGAGGAEVPDADADTPALRAAAASVPRINTNAPSCGAASSGSGFVIGPGSVMTNAHVVAGARDVVVTAPGGFPRPARVVYFDPAADIAVLAVDGLEAPPLPFATTPAVGETVFFQGYPYGGPFTSRSASVLATGPTPTLDITGRQPVTRSVTSIAGVVEPGNSGGPLLTTDGAVAGMIFARSETSTNAGFALAMEELAPVLAEAPGLSAEVPTGACAR